MTFCYGLFVYRSIKLCAACEKFRIYLSYIPTHFSYPKESVYHQKKQASKIKYIK